MTASLTPETAQGRDVLVVGSVNYCLDRRQELVRRGYRVTVARTGRQAVAFLQRHPFAMCRVQLACVERDRRLLRRLRDVSAQSGVPLHEDLAA